MNALALFSIKIMELELYFSHKTVTFCTNPGWFTSAISLDICKHCLAILLSGKFC